MKKIFLFLFYLLILINGLYAITGIATIEPAQLPNNSYGHTITINFYPANIMTWSNGRLQIYIPPEFPNLPNLNPTDNGYVEAILIRGGVIEEPISNSNILIEGYTITINALTFNNGDFLKVIYGSKRAGGYGIGTPIISGTYYFYILENSTGGNPSMIESQPSIFISNLALLKTASQSYVMAKDNFNYYITYSNLSYNHSIENIYIWDTIPSQFNIDQIVPQPSFINGNFVAWNIGTMMYMTAGNILIKLSARDGIIKDGTQIINSVSAKGNDMYGNTYNVCASNTVNVYGTDFNIIINAMPANVARGQNITVLMHVTNNGNTIASYVKPDSFNFSGSGYVTLLTGPAPSLVNSLLPAQVAKFTWTYSAEGPGGVIFSGRAMCYEGPAGRTVYSKFEQSNLVTIVYPPTSTPTKTLTPLPTSTFIIPTETFAETATSTIIPPSFTATATFVNTPQRQQKQIDEKVYLDRNYLNPDKGEKVKIKYRVPGNGKVSVKIYNLTGEHIMSYVKDYQGAGLNEIEWDARNKAGKIVGRGIYFLHISIEGGNEIRRVYVVK